MCRTSFVNEKVLSRLDTFVVVTTAIRCGVVRVVTIINAESSLDLSDLTPYTFYTSKCRAPSSARTMHGEALMLYTLADAGSATLALRYTPLPIHERG